MYRNYAPSVADTMSVWSGASLRGSVYGAGPMEQQFKPQLPVKKPPIYRAPVAKFQAEVPKLQVELLPGNPYAAMQAAAKPKSIQGKRRPQSVYGGSARPGAIKATGQLAICPGVGPFLPQGAAAKLVRPMYKGRPPQATGVFDAQTKFPPTKFSELYHQGDIPCRIDLKGGEDEKPSGPVGGRALLWLVPPKDVDLDRYLPVFAEGLREKQEPQMFMAHRGLEELIDATPSKRLAKALRGIVYPIKDSLRTLDDDICVKTINIILRIAKKSDKLAEAFVPHFHLILPNVDILRNMHMQFGSAAAASRLAGNRRPRSSFGGGAQSEKKFVKLENLRRNVVNLSELVQSMLEYLERHGGLYAYVTIKKLIPRYESVLFN